VAFRHPLLALDRFEDSDLADAAGRLEGVEDRFVSRKALQAEYLPGQQQAVVAELDVPLLRHVAEALVEGHGTRISPPGWVRSGAPLCFGARRSPRSRARRRRPPRAPARPRA